MERDTHWGIRVWVGHNNKSKREFDSPSLGSPLASGWKKKVKGKPIYFKFPDSGRATSQALEAWAAWKKEHDQPFDPDGQRQRLERMVGVVSEFMASPKAKKGTLAEIEKALRPTERVPARLEITNKLPTWQGQLSSRPVRDQLDQTGKMGMNGFRIGSRPTPDANSPTT